MKLQTLLSFEGLRFVAKQPRNEIIFLPKTYYSRQIGFLLIKCNKKTTSDKQNPSIIRAFVASVILEMEAIGAYNGCKYCPVSGVYRSIGLSISNSSLS